MSALVEVKTAELIGPALDWAVGKVLAADDPRLYQEPKFSGWLFGPFGKIWNPSADWEQAGPLIDDHTVRVSSYPKEQGEGRATARLWLNGKVYWQSGQSPLIAVCRAIVAASLGEVVQVPAVLLPEVSRG